RTATLACTVFLLLFAFAQYTTVRNYNYVCPYSHEMTHGLLLALTALAAAWQTPRWGCGAAASAGLLLGLVAIGKIELTIAAAAGVFTSVALMSWQSQLRTPSIAARLATVAACAAIPVGAAVLWLSSELGATEAARSCLGGWLMASANEIRQLDFYRRGMGTLDLPASVAAMTVSAARWTVLAVAGAALSSIVGSAGRRMALGVGVGAAIAFSLSGFDWPLMERALPLLLIGLIAWQFGALLLSWRDRGDFARYGVLPVGHRRYGADEVDAMRLCRRVGWCTFSLALLAKIALYSRIAHYGFVLAAPAALTVVAAVFHWLPAALTARGRNGAALAWLTAPLLIAYATAYQCQQQRQIARDVTLGHGDDQFVVGASAAAIVTAQQRIETHVGDAESLVVLPEGVMLNYVTRRLTPTRYITWMPPELYHFGERQMLDALRNAPPDWVLLADRDLEEYGVPPLGQGYADSIADWIDGRYAEVDRWDEGGWRLLKEREEVAKQTSQAN
ncbi:MAG: hypothetical protein AAF961_07010, partial [Planctomycetota bacterium]